MKTLLMLFVLSFGLASKADRLSLTGSLSTDSFSFETKNSQSNQTFSSDESKTSVDLGLSYLKEFEFPVGLDQELSINLSKSDNFSKAWFGRYDFLASIEINESIRFKFGPSLAYWYNRESDNLTGFGYRGSLEYSYKESLFLDLGYYRSSFSRSFEEFKTDTKVDSLKIKVGFGF